MKKNTLESLPNELLLIIFSYLSSFDLCRTFLDVKNARIQRLLTSMRHWLDVSSMHYGQFCQFLSNNNDTTKRFTAMVDTAVLRDTCACRALFDYWIETIDGRQLLNMWPPSIKQLLVLNAEYYPYIVRCLLKPLVFSNNVLQYLHLVFERPTSTYSSVLSDLVSYRIPVPTMVLEVKQGMS
jgi:hypothetical protein